MQGAGQDYTDAAVENWRALRTDVDLSRFEVGMRIMRLSTIMRATLDETIAAAGFSVLGDYEVAAMLRRSHNAMLPSDIADRLRLTRAGVTGRLNRLERQKFVRRTKSGDDSRNVFVTLTERGRRATDRAFDARIACEHELFGPLTADELAQLAALLKLIAVHEDPRVTG